MWLNLVHDRAGDCFSDMDCLEQLPWCIEVYGHLV